MKKLYAGRLILQPSAVLRLRIFDRYAIHRIMQDLFHSDLVLGHVAATGDAPSGIQWADKGEHLAGRVIDFLANRRPGCSVPEDVDLQCRELPEDFLLHDRYRFQVELNPVRCVNRKRRVPVIGDQALRAWFLEKAERSGMRIEALTFDRIGTEWICKPNGKIPFNQARASGILSVTDRELFAKVFESGFGKGRAFGFGFFQVAII